MPPTSAVILGRIRKLINEATSRYWQDPDLMDWYSDGVAQQLREVLSMADALGLKECADHPFLRQYATYREYAILVGTQTYDLPTDYVEGFGFSLSDVSNAREQDAQRIGLEDQWGIENIPHFAPSYDRPKWSIDVVSGSSVKLKVYVHGDRGKPSQPAIGRLYYFREPTRAATTGSVDCNDPFNKGPVWRAVAEATARRGADPTLALSMATNASLGILGPLAASQAAQAASESKAAGKAVSAGDSRDAG